MPGAGPLPAGPRRHNLPFLSIGNLLKGRDWYLQGLADSLQGASRATAITQQHVIHGLGGIGKTRLAVEYAWRSGDRYEAAFFVVADSRASLRSGLAKLSRLLLPDLPAGQAEDEVVEAVLTCLQEQNRWLLILDNVDTEEAERAVLEILPSLSNGHVFVTSRRADWPEGIDERSLDKLPPEEAARFLLERTAKRRASATDDEIRASDLATILDGLPLALEQAAAYIRHRRISLSDYLKDWERERDAVLGWFDPTAMQYPASVAVTWQKTADELGPMARALLRLCAFLAPDPIPVEMFEECKDFVDEAVSLLCKETEEEQRPQAVVEALGDLADYSMISHEGRTFRVHRMVQEVIRSRVPGDRQRDWIEESLKIVDRYSPFDADDVRTWPVWDLLRPHATAVVGHAEGSGIWEPTDRLMNQLGELLYTKGLYGETERLLRRGLELVEAAQGTSSPELAISLNNLAQLLKATNRLTEAEPLMRHALAIDEASFGPNHPEVATDLNNLAQLFKATNRLTEAEPLMRRVLAIDEVSFGKEHPNVAIDLNNLTSLLQSTNRLEEAEPLRRRALAIDEASFGNEHPKVAIRLNNLARLLQDANRLAEAEPLMRRAVEIWEQSLGPDHPNTQIGLRNLEVLLSKIADGQDRPEPG
jgi:tetratricopeptide (TPR) repeat protein